MRNRNVVIAEETMTETVGSRLPKDLLDKLDILVSRGDGGSRSDIIRSILTGYFESMDSEEEARWSIFRESMRDPGELLLYFSVRIALTSSHIQTRREFANFAARALWRHGDIGLPEASDKSAQELTRLFLTAISVGDPSFKELDQYGNWELQVRDVLEMCLGRIGADITFFRVAERAVLRLLSTIMFVDTWAIDTPESLYPLLKAYKKADTDLLCKEFEQFFRNVVHSVENPKLEEEIMPEIKKVIKGIAGSNGRDKTKRFGE